jgi:hypothetical protein
MILHCGQYIASPFVTRSCSDSNKAEGERVQGGEGSLKPAWHTINNDWYLKHLLCFLGGFIIGSSPLQVVLILLTIHALVDSLAQDTVLLRANRAVELIDLVLIEAEPLAVGCAAVEAVWSCILCLPEASLIQSNKLFLGNNLRDSVVASNKGKKITINAPTDSSIVYRDLQVV